MKYSLSETGFYIKYKSCPSQYLYFIIYLVWNCCLYILYSRSKTNIVKDRPEYVWDMKNIFSVIYERHQFYLAVAEMMN